MGAARQAPPLLPGAAAFLLDLRPGLGAAAAPELGGCCVPLALELDPRDQLPLETEGNIVSLRPAPVLPPRSLRSRTCFIAFTCGASPSCLNRS